jgi:hypothetical protein
MRKLLAWWRRRADREALTRLDAHSLRDVGLESWNGLLAERLHARRQREVLRLAAARIGAY